MPWLLSKVTGKLCEQLSEGYFLGPNLWIDQTSISSCMEGEGERKQREKGGRENTEEKNRKSRKDMDWNCFPESVLWGMEVGELSAGQLAAVPRELWPCQSLAAAAAWAAQLDRGRGWAPSTPRRSLWPMSFGGFDFPQAKTSLENFQGPTICFFYAMDTWRGTKSSSEWRYLGTIPVPYF